jgi:acyl carrier protein
MNNQEIIAKLNTLLADEFEVKKESITPSANILDGLDIDSLDLIDLIVLIENNFGFKINNEEISGIRTIQDFYDYVIKRIEEKGNS